MTKVFIVEAFTNLKFEIILRPSLWQSIAHKGSKDKTQHISLIHSNAIVLSLTFPEESFKGSLRPYSTLPFKIRKRPLDSCPLRPPYPNCCQIQGASHMWERRNINHAYNNCQSSIFFMNCSRCRCAHRWSFLLVSLSLRELRVVSAATHRRQCAIAARHTRLQKSCSSGGKMSECRSRLLETKMSVFLLTWISIFPFRQLWQAQKRLWVNFPPWVFRRAMRRVMTGSDLLLRWTQARMWFILLGMIFRFSVKASLPSYSSAVCFLPVRWVICDQTGPEEVRRED